MVRIGTEATRKEALIASVSFNPKKKNDKFKVTTAIAARIKLGQSAFLIVSFLEIKTAKIKEAASILIKAREKMGISVKVSFMMGAVAPQIMAAVEANKNAEFILRANIVSREVTETE